MRPKEEPAFLYENLICIQATPDDVAVLKWVNRATSKDPDREVLQGILFETGSMIAIDGFRIHKAIYPESYKISFPIGFYKIKTISHHLVILENPAYKGHFPDYGAITNGTEKRGLKLKNVGDTDRYMTMFAINPKLLSDAMEIKGCGVAQVEVRGGPLFIHMEYGFHFQLEAYIMPMFLENTNYRLADGGIGVRKVEELMEIEK